MHLFPESLSNYVLKQPLVSESMLDIALAFITSCHESPLGQNVVIYT